jgi:hypothetical protein
LLQQLLQLPQQAVVLRTYLVLILLLWLLLLLGPSRVLQVLTFNSSTLI